MVDLAAPLATSDKSRRYKQKQRDLERTVERLKEEMKEMRAQNAAVQTSMLITHQSHERSIKKLEERMDCVEELEGYINGVEEYFEEAKNKHAADLTQLETRLTQRLRLDDFCNTNAESMSNYMLNNQCGLRYLDKTHKEQLASLEERLTQRLDDVQETNKTTVKNEDVHLARLDEAHQEQLASLEARLTKRLDDMSKTNAESLHSNRLSNQCGLAYLEKMHKAELTSLGARLTKRMGDVLLENNKATQIPRRSPGLRRQGAQGANGQPRSATLAAP